MLQCTSLEKWLSLEKLEQFLSLEKLEQLEQQPRPGLPGGGQHGDNFSPFPLALGGEAGERVKR